MPLLGVSLTLLLAAAVDLLIGLALLRALSPGRWTPGVVAVAALGSLTLGGLLHWGIPDRLLQSAGMFRTGKDDLSQRELLFYRDGATASVSVIKDHGARVIATNGKPDAGLNPLNEAPGPDEVTMMMLGALPLAAHPNPQDVAIIGWGSGLSTHAVLGSALPRHVDTIEIEPAMWEGAKLLSPQNWRAYQDPRSKVHFEDAREFFARGQRRYDVVISEPSNPWISGVASLFTHEFYRGVKRSLKPGGLLVQWVHSYEISDALLTQMIAALLQEFPDSEVYASNAADLLILAPTASVPAMGDEPWRSPLLAAELRRVGLASVVDIQARRLGGPAVLRTYVRLTGAPVHSDFFPTVSLLAPQQRYSGSTASLLQTLAALGPPVLQVLDCRPHFDREPEVHVGAEQEVLKIRQQALWAMDRFAGRATPATPGGESSRLIDGVLAQRNGTRPLDADALMVYLANLAVSILPHVPEQEQQALWAPGAWLRARPELPPVLQDQLTMYDSFARRHWNIAEAAAERLLRQPSKRLPAALREQALVLGMLAAKAAGHTTAVRDWEQRWGSDVARGPFNDARRFMKAWEDGGEKVCAAAR